MTRQIRRTHFGFFRSLELSACALNCIGVIDIWHSLIVFLIVCTDCTHLTAEGRFDFEDRCVILH